MIGTIVFHFVKEKKIGFEKLNDDIKYLKTSEKPNPPGKNDEDKKEKKERIKKTTKIFK